MSREPDAPRRAPIPFAEIRARAYELWDRNHRPEGSEITFWLMAERELRSERDALESDDPMITGRHREPGSHGE